jgi:ferric-dicitrate binding protein FerR (iron transport regulator)
MPVEPTRLQYLLQQYAANNCTKQEVIELFQAIKDVHDDEALESSLHHIWQNINASDSFPDLDREKLFSNIMSADPPVIKRRSFVWMRAAAAAIVIIVTGWVLYAWLHTGKKPEQHIVVARNNFKNDVAPGGNKAILTLADGSTIILDSAHNGSLAQQGNTSVNKLNNGQLEYKALTGSQSSAITYNTLVVPRGGQYQVILPDGTKVWLNAASSLKYPTAFTGSERQVVLSGEAYFEVAHSQKIPFIVDITPHSGGQKGGRVEVLGTHFNIMAYADEEGIKTTLLEGKVKVSQPATGNGHEAMLQPGQQAVLKNNSDVKVIDNINTDEVVAWKNGIFDFRSADIHAVMRQLSRWYDIDVNYSAEAKDRFYAKIPRNIRLSDVLQALTLTGKIHFEVDGKKVTVLP